MEENKNNLENVVKYEIQNSKQIINSIVYFNYPTNIKEEKVTVKIEICFITKTFNILNENSNFEFKFKGNSHQYIKWIAVCRAIENGILEARKMLDLN